MYAALAAGIAVPATSVSSLLPMVRRVAVPNLATLWLSPRFSIQTLPAFGELDARAPPRQQDQPPRTVSPTPRSLRQQTLPLTLQRFLCLAYDHYYWSWDAVRATSVVTWGVTTIDTTYTVSATDLADESKGVSEINASLSALSVEATSLYAVLTASPTDSTSARASWSLLTAVSSDTAPSLSSITLSTSADTGTSSSIPPIVPSETAAGFSSTPSSTRADTQSSETASTATVTSIAASSTTTTGTATTTTTTQSAPQLGASGSGNVAIAATLMLVPLLVALVWL
ncbi:hypothetical protein LTR22_002825 [Elasticomyces elasticus]|nr:hypothetical protein LTR22_002825 [Elasticomyces elasticus]KAK4910352.1 hypothetical protein LTR49_020959 [Elasticomyces elasticus]KAK5763593.1 hypothetical protein LTS12_006150 [Elasticomyces elasticus]